MPAFVDPLVKAVIALFIITDAPGNLPFFMSLTEGNTSVERRKIFSTAVITAFVMLMFFLLTGTAILDLFGADPRNPGDPRRCLRQTRLIREHGR